MTFRLRELATYSFTCNVGSTDRAIRLIIGVALVVVAIWLLDFGALQVAGAVVGGAIALTGLVSRCGVYYLLGLSTRPPT